MDAFIVAYPAVSIVGCQPTSITVDYGSTNSIHSFATLASSTLGIAAGTIGLNGRIVTLGAGHCRFTRDLVTKFGKEGGRKKGELAWTEVSPCGRGRRPREIQIIGSHGL